MSKGINDTILVSVDFTQGDVGVLIVGRNRHLTSPIQISEMDIQKEGGI